MLNFTKVVSGSVSTVQIQPTYPVDLKGAAIARKIAEQKTNSSAAQEEVPPEPGTTVPEMMTVAVYDPQLRALVSTK